ncbi:MULTISPECIES: hypothetical protein [Aeromonas]|uniref:hypothetical protein n=1 Tax=Aeromonas TaxID=642 RepID=UPI0022E65974|nr:hypothetical protein [Aeromonas sp. Y318-3]
MAKPFNLRDLLRKVFSRRKRATFVRAERPVKKPRFHSSIAAEKAVMEHQRKANGGIQGRSMPYVIFDEAERSPSVRCEDERDERRSHRDTDSQAAVFASSCYDHGSRDTGYSSGDSYSSGDTCSGSSSAGCD